MRNKKGHKSITYGPFLSYYLGRLLAMVPTRFRAPVPAAKHWSICSPKAVHARHIAGSAPNGQAIAGLFCYERTLFGGSLW